MRTRLPSLLAVLALLAVACGGTVDEAREADSTPSFDALTPLGAGDPLPAAELAMLDGDGVLDTRTLEGPAVINFWATWCPFCVEEMPDFEQVHADLGDEVRFIGVDREDDHTKARTLADETGVTYELVTDPDGSFFRAVKGRGMPTTLLVDGEGRIVLRHAGPLNAEELTELVREHLDVDV